MNTCIRYTPVAFIVTLLYLRWGLNAKELECLLTSNSDVLEEVRPSGLDDKASKMWGFKQAWGTMKTDLSIFLGARPGLGVTVWNFTHR